MQVLGKTEIPRSRRAVWRGLTNAEVLTRCIPGCEDFVQTGPSQFSARARIKAGPVKTSLAIAITLTDIDPPDAEIPRSWSLEAIATSPIGTATASAAISLNDANGGSVLSYHCKAVLGGKLALFSGSWVDRAAKPAMDAFFERFRGALPEDEPEIEAKAETQNDTAVLAPCGPETTEDIPALPPHKGAHSKLWAYAGAAAGAVIAAGAVFLFRHHKKAS